MKRRVTIIIAVLLVLFVATALVACDPSGTQGGTSGGTGTDGTTETVTVTPCYLNVNNPTSNMAKAFVDEFSVDDITYSVVEQVVRKNSLTGEIISTTTRDRKDTEGEVFTASGDVLLNGDQDLELLRTAGTHLITVVATVDGVTVKGTTKVFLKDYPVATHNVTVNYKAADGSDAFVVKAAKEGSTLSYGSTFLSKYNIPSSYSYTDGGVTVTKYLSHFTIANQAAIFAPAGTAADPGVTVCDTLTVSESVTLTAVYSDTKNPVVEFTFAVNAPDDIVWTYDTAAERNDVVVSVVAGSLVSDIRTASDYSSANYQLKFWKKADSTQFIFNGERIYADTVVTAYWEKKTFDVTLTLGSGAIGSDYVVDSVEGLTRVESESTFTGDGKLNTLTFKGIEYGKSLDEFYADIKVAADGTITKRVALADLFDASSAVLVRSGYEFGGIYAKGSGEEYDVTADITGAVSLLASWTPDVANIDDAYYDNTYEFEMLIDGTYAISGVKDASATLLYVPAEYKGVPVTRINDNAAAGKAMVTVLDLSSAVNLEYIGAGAFSGCVALTEIRSPEGGGSLTYIAAGAFEGIGYNPYRNGNLIIGNVLVIAAPASDGTGVLDLSGADFNYIAGGAFNDTTLVEVILPSELKGIADGAFVAVSPAKSFKIGSSTASMEYLGADIGLDEFDDGNTDDAFLTIGNALYRYTGDEESLNLTATGTTVIAGGAFKDAPNLVSLAFDESKMVYIGENAFSDKFIANNTDENGFFVVNGILIKYRGTAKQVTLPADVVTINTSAFANAGLSNLIIPVGSKLTTIKENAFKNAGKLNVTVRAKESAAEIAFTAEVNAFTNWTGGIYVEYYPDPTTSGTGGMTTARIYNDLFAGDSAAMWNWLKNNNKAFAVQVTSIEVSSNKLPNIFVTAADGSIDFFAAAKAWNNDPAGNTVFAENGNYSIFDAVTVRRNDGLSTTEDFVIAQSAVNDSFEAAKEGAQGGTATDGYPGVLVVSAANSTVAADLIPASGVSVDFNYVIYAGIEQLGLKDPDGAFFAADDVIGLYSTYGDITTRNYYIKQLTLVVTYTNGAEEEYPIANYANSVKLAVNAGDGTLTFSYTKQNYASSKVTSTGEVTFKYEVKEPAPEKITLADNMALDSENRYHASLNTALQTYNEKIRFTVHYSDGFTTESVTFGSGYVTVTGFSTLTYGERTATVVYNKDDVRLEMQFVYFVDATAQTDFTFAYVDAAGEIILGIDGKTVIEVGDWASKPDNAVGVIVTGYSGAGVAVAIPAEYVYTDADGATLGTMPVVAIGDSAFITGNGKYITSIYIPATVESIGERAFENCTNLNTVYLSEATALSSIGRYAFKGTTALGAIDLSATAVTVIRTGAFYGSGIATAALGNAVTIEAQGFYDCENLTSVTTTVAGNIMSVGSMAFYNCMNLQDVSGISQSEDAIIAKDAFSLQIL